MKFFKKILAFFTNKPSKGYVYERPTSESVIETLSVQQLAERTGKKNLPAEDASNLDGNERHIAAHISEEVTKSRDLSISQLNGLIERLRALDFQSALVHLKNVSKSKESRISTITSEAKREFASLNAEIEETQAQLDNFKHANKLNRVADFPDSRVMYFSIIVFILILETGLNGYFFGKGSDFGYLGGATQAFIISIVNVFLAFITGRFILPYKNHINTPKSLGALVLTFCMFLVLVGFNLFVAHYRDAFILDPDNAMNLVVPNFQAAPFSLHDFDSWLLWILGCLMSLGIIYDAYAMDDAYPSYGALVRKLEGYKYEYAELRDEVIEEIRMLRRDYDKEIEKLNDELEEQQDILRNTLAMKDNIVKNYSEHLVQLEQVGIAVIQTYRDENCRHRDTPPPAYFNEPWVLEVKPSLEVDQISYDSFNDELKALTQVPKIINEIRFDMNRIFRNTLDNLEKL